MLRQDRMRYVFICSLTVCPYELCVFQVRDAGTRVGLEGVDVASLDPAALELLFKVFDRDGDGRIDPSEEWVIRPWPQKPDDVK